jgi:hypothetical protein
MKKISRILYTTYYLIIVIITFIPALIYFTIYDVIHQTQLPK